MKIFAEFFKNKIGWMLVLFNAIVLTSGLVLRGGFFRGFHLFYEPIPIWIFVFLNFPALFVAELLIQTFAPVERMASSMIWVADREFFALLIISVIQWLLIGLLFEKVRGPSKN